MDKKRILDLLKNVSSGKTSAKQAYSLLKNLPYEDLGFAKLDHHRAMRKGFPEVVYCEGKTVQQITAIFKKLAKKSPTVIGTRVSKEAYKKIRKALPKLNYEEQARIVYLGEKVDGRRKMTKDRLPATGSLLPFLCVLTAGTADIPVAEEAAVTAELLGNRVDRIYDVGVAGIHRLIGNMERISKASVIIVVAGMEGALGSVVAGLAEAPVIAVPTSVGYGASFKGLAALLTMMNSCAPGIAVVNIDNGFGAGVMAHTILRLK